MATVLQMQGIDRSFGGVHALIDVAFDLQTGEVHALVGQNGAGKSTLIKILAGALQPDAGTIQIDGKPVTLASPAAALQLGIGTVYQDPLVYPELTVTENIFTGRELRDRPRKYRQTSAGATRTGSAPRSKRGSAAGTSANG